MKTQNEIEEIKKNKPNGATHYYLSYKSWIIYYFKLVNKDIFMWNDITKQFSKSSYAVSLKPL